MRHVLRGGKVLAIEHGGKADAADMIAYMNRVGGESDNLTFGKDGCRYTLEAEEAFLESMQVPGALSAALLGRVDGELVSVGTLAGNTRARLAHNCELGITVRRDFWRMGIGEAMMRAMLDFARGTGVQRIVHLRVRGDNVGAIALYEKLGFEKVGTHRAEMCVNGVYVDTVLMDLHLWA